MTAQELIEYAFSEIGVLTPGKALAATDLAWGVVKFNMLLKTLSKDGANLFYKVEESFSLVSGTAVYTIGSGGDFDTVRPDDIEVAFMRDSANHDYPVAIRAMDEYWSISDKTVQDRPYALFYEREFPLGKIYLYYTPQTTEALHIVSFKPLTTYTDIDVDVDLPGDYEELLMSNLAVRLCSRYGKTPTQELKDLARDTLADTKSENIGKTMTGVNVNYNGYSRGTYDIEEG